MKTLAKRPAEGLMEAEANTARCAADTIWDPDHEKPFWQMWGSGYQPALVHLRHLSVLVPQELVTADAEREQFSELAAQWESETEFLSRQSEAVLNRAYQRIIGMGQAAVPLILERLRDNPDNWFWALASITGEDPGAGSSSLLEAREAWLTWGRERGLLD